MGERGKKKVTKGGGNRSLSVVMQIYTGRRRGRVCRQERAAQREAGGRTILFSRGQFFQTEIFKEWNGSEPWHFQQRGNWSAIVWNSGGKKATTFFKKKETRQGKYHGDRP